MPPPPGDFVAVVVVYGGLSLLPESGSQVAALFGWGLVLATALNFWSPSTPTKIGATKAPATQGGK